MQPRWVRSSPGSCAGNGGDVDPSIVMTGDGSLVVLSLTNGGVLVSRTDGCTFERALGPLQGQRGVDLTLDPSRPGRVLALLSTIIEVIDAGYQRLRNLLAQALDHGGSWEVLAELPDDFSAETVEVAASSAERIYVGGTAAEDPLQGIVERSDDVGSVGSEADRVWFRVPGRGDIYGVLPARLWRSTDGAASFEPLCAALAARDELRRCPTRASTLDPMPANRSPQVIAPLLRLRALLRRVRGWHPC